MVVYLGHGVLIVVIVLEARRANNSQKPTETKHEMHGTGRILHYYQG